MPRSREVTCDVVKVINEDVNPHNGSKTRLQVVCWNKGKPTLEKRPYAINNDGQERSLKSKGLTVEDFDIILQNADEIRTILEVKTESK
jgi:hypothetical protein